MVRSTMVEVSVSGSQRLHMNRKDVLVQLCVADISLEYSHVVAKGYMLERQLLQPNRRT